MKSGKHSYKKAIPYTPEGLRQALFDELNLLRAGRTTTWKARATALLARQILHAAQLELLMGGSRALDRPLEIPLRLPGGMS